MRRPLVLTMTLGLAFGLAGAAVQPGQAQTGGPKSGAANGPAAAGYTQLFISPCGEPYRGRPGDPYPVALWFKQADLNHDGVIDRAEFRADHEGFFDALDSDGNGVLEGPELTFYEQRVVPDILGPGSVALNAGPRSAGPDRMGARLFLAQVIGQSPEGSHSGDAGLHGYDGPGGVHGPSEDLGSRRRPPKELLGAAAYSLLAEPEPVRAADTNLDGRITKAEFLAAADRRFKLLDKRKDGKLTLDELPLTAAQVQLAKRR